MASGSTGGHGKVPTSGKVQIFEPGKRKKLPTEEDRKKAKEAAKKQKQEQQQKASSESKKSRKQAKMPVSTNSFVSYLLKMGWLRTVGKSNCVLL